MTQPEVDKWIDYTKNTIGESLWQKLKQKDRDFLVEASHMFNLGKKVNIDRIFRSLAQ